jgi:hypothetical protein
MVRTVYMVFRLPCLQEDEGREFHEGTFETKRAAKDFIERATDHDRGYFKQSDYEIRESERKL